MGHLIFLILMKFQSTLPRRERLDRTVELRDGYYISIHAPAKGATLAIFLAVAIFIYFNPRSREGSDPNVKPSAIPTKRISIHAPAKGATLYFRA